MKLKIVAYCEPNIKVKPFDKEDLLRMQCTLQNDLDFMDKIKANDLKLIMRHTLHGMEVIVERKNSLFHLLI